ncbi:hypothetical protein [Cyanobium usitatum]|uniref:hypothetical protein n=1 Tax=Cyanobium usitatum TaxID=2304190 RepID=UPI002AD37EB0|nr:hypothetical protein [Cyanobium usitatum]
MEPAPWLPHQKTANPVNRRTAALGGQPEALPAQWAPPPDLSTIISRSRESRAVTTPIAVPDILAMVQAIPDPRWRFAFQLLSAFGLRP